MKKIFIDSRRKSDKTLSGLYPNSKLIDVTSKAQDEFIRFSPFYPHGGIPIPFSKGETAMCVEGIWQGLKVFSSADIDPASFVNDKMKNLKRTVTRFGTPLGHRKGTKGNELLGYLEARIQLYLPTYLWMLENKVDDLIQKLKTSEQNIVLLDYDINSDLNNLKSPLSHASLIKAYLEGNYYPCEKLSL